jgi:hypothetical protein|eukprot:COSAG02_NODE_8284_length_2632_cov_2.280300_2_plen_83_part_00
MQIGNDEFRLPSMLGIPLATALPWYIYSLSSAPEFETAPEIKEAKSTIHGPFITVYTNVKLRSYTLLHHICLTVLTRLVQSS